MVQQRRQARSEKVHADAEVIDARVRRDRDRAGAVNEIVRHLVDAQEELRRAGLIDGSGLLRLDLLGDFAVPYDDVGSALADRRRELGALEWHFEAEAVGVVAVEGVFHAARPGVVTWRLGCHEA